MNLGNGKVIVFAGRKAKMKCGIPAKRGIVYPFPLRKKEEIEYTSID